MALDDDVVGLEGAWDELELTDWDDVVGFGGCAEDDDEELFTPELDDELRTADEDVVGLADSCEEVDTFTLEDEVVGFGGTWEELELEACEVVDTLMLEEEVVGFGGAWEELELGVCEDVDVFTLADEVVGFV